jgi:hypothetical protein
LTSASPAHSGRRFLPAVAEAGWAGVKNGELLRLASDRFDVLITVDRNLEYQQNLSELAI